MLLSVLMLTGLEVVIGGGFILTLLSCYEEEGSNASIILGVLASYFWPLWWAAKAIPLPSQLFLAEAR